WLNRISAAWAGSTAVDRAKPVPVIRLAAALSLTRVRSEDNRGIFKETPPFRTGAARAAKTCDRMWRIRPRGPKRLDPPSESRSKRLGREHRIGSHLLIRSRRS